MYRVVKKIRVISPLVRHLVVMARKPSPMPPLEIIDINMDEMDWDYLKNRPQSPIIIGNTRPPRIWRPNQAIDGFFYDLHIERNEREKPEKEVGNEEKPTDK